MIREEGEQDVLPDVDQSLETSTSSCVSTDLAVRRVLSQLVSACKGGGDDVEVGEHHTLRLSQ